MFSGRNTLDASGGDGNVDGSVQLHDRSDQDMNYERTGLSRTK